MVSKKILGVAIAAAFVSQGAFASLAPLDLTASPTPYKIAKQALTTAAQIGSTGYYAAVDTGVGSIDQFDVTSKLGIGLAVNQKIYVKVSLTNAKFNAAVATTDLAVTSASVDTASVDTIAQGGNVGDTYAIFSVSPATGDAFAVSDTATLTLNALQVNGSDVTVTVTTYDSVASAVAGTNVLYTASAKTLTFPTDGATAATSSVNTVTASVNALFKNFIVGGPASGTTAQLASLFTTVNSYADLTGAPITLASVANLANSTVTFHGDFSVGAWSVNGMGTVPLTVSADKQSATVALSSVVDGTGAPVNPNLVVVENGTTQIPKATYTADVTFAAPTGGAFGAVAAVMGQAAGTITRDGTTVLVPFVNINPDYNQKIIIVNRSAADAALTLTNLVPDAAATASSITATTINLPAGKQSVLKTTDLVSITGSAKGAVTLNIAAPSSKIDVLFQSTNAQGAQNTVLLQNDGAKFGGASL